MHVPNRLPVHEVTVYVDKYRTKGRAANAIHSVCGSLALIGLLTLPGVAVLVRNIIRNLTESAGPFSCAKLMSIVQL